MKIAINATSAIYGGGIIYLTNLIAHLAKIDVKNEYYILMRNIESPELDCVKNQNFKIIKFRFVRFPIVRVLWEQIALPIFLMKRNIDILYSPTDITSIFAACKKVLAIRNITPYLQFKVTAELKYRLRLKLLRNLTKLSIWKTKKVIFTSYNSKKIISRQLGIPDSKGVVVYHGRNKIFSQGMRFHNEFNRDFTKFRPYILFVSFICVHKNHHSLIEAFNILAKRYKMNYNLVVAGRVMDKKYFCKIRKRAEDLGIIDRIYFLGEVEYSQLPLLYKNADIFIFPSWMETFGHPLVEAMSSGVPVLASNIDVCSEICRDAAVYFDPFDPGEMAEKTQMLLRLSSLQQELRKKGPKRAQDFSWEKTARETLKVFEEIYNS